MSQSLTGSRNRSLYTEEQVVDIVAKVMRYGADHFDDEWRNAENSSFRVAMESISMCVACWLAQHTRFGGGGVDWDVVYPELLESKWGSPDEYWLEISRRVVRDHGGVV